MREKIIPVVSLSSPSIKMMLIFGEKGMNLEIRELPSGFHCEY